jgi:hypothetical protein
MIKKFLTKIFNIKTIYKGTKKFKFIHCLFFNFKIEVFSVEKIKNSEPKKIKNLKIESNSTSKKNYASVCAIYKNEPDIKEWIEYHKLIGFEKFYLYDNESDDNSKDIIQPYIDDGTVIYHYIQGKCVQLDAYRDAVARYKNNTEWLAIIDLDEYICPVINNNIKDILQLYKHYPAIGINWVMFDSNNYQKRPDKLVIEAYSRVLKNYQSNINHHIKTILRPKEVKYITNPHYAFYKHNKTALDENFNIIGNALNYNNDSNAFTAYNSVNYIRINHYHTKSLEDYQRKIKIGFADHDADRPVDDEHLNFKSESTEDLAIQKYLPDLKERMGIK